MYNYQSDCLTFASCFVFTRQFKVKLKVRKSILKITVIVSNSMFFFDFHSQQDAPSKAQMCPLKSRSKKDTLSLCPEGPTRHTKIARLLDVF